MSAADLASVIRSLRSRPGYTAAVVLIFAVVLGANAAMFSAVDAALLRPIEARDVGRLVVGWASDPAKNVPVIELSQRTIDDWRTASRRLEQVAAFGSSAWPALFDGPDGYERLASAGVSAGFFDTLGVRPLLGRTFRPDDDAPNAERVVVLSHRLWVSRFAADPGIVGKPIALETPHTIVGVMPAGFVFPHQVDLWTTVGPVLADVSADIKADARAVIGVLYLLGRTRGTATAREAAAELDAIASQLEGSTGQRPGSAVTVVPLVDFLLGPVRRGLWALFAAVGILLLIACANISGLLLARLAQRRHEFAIRLGLGAPIAHLRWLCLVESAILAAAGSLFGWLLAHWFVRTLVMLAPENLGNLPAASVDARTAVFTSLAGLTAALLCSVWPMRYLTLASPGVRHQPRGVLHASPHRAHATLVGIQIALAVVLLITAGLLGRSVVNLARVDLGFTASGVVTMNVTPRAVGLAASDDWYSQLVTRIEAIPTVTRAGVVAQLPLRPGPIGADSWIVLEGQADTPATRRANPAVNFQIASPGYFPAMGIAVRRGRLFADRDDTRTVPVVLVSEGTARTLWPGESPIGRRVLLPDQAGDAGAATWRTVVGVVDDVRYRGLTDLRLDVYEPLLQSPAAAANIVVRTTSDPAAMLGVLRSSIRGFDATAIVGVAGTMADAVARATAPWRFSVWVLALFAAVACLLASAGLFSVVALDVVERRRELALRVALGAQRSDVLRLTFVRVSWDALPGIATGVVVASAATTLIESLLFGVTGLDVRTYAVVVALVVSIVGVASYLPARRAAAIDPLPVLKGE